MKLQYLLLCAALLFTPLSQAQFDISGEGKVTLTDNSSKTFDFGFSYFRQDGTYRFNAGKQSLNVPSVPQKYSIAVILQDNSHVWVPDFVNEPLSSFELQLEQYSIKLFADPLAVNAPGNFVLQLNDETYYFNRGPGQINFYFTETGIRDVRVEGMFKPRK